MSIAELRKKVKATIDGLPAVELRSAADYVIFLSEQSREAASNDSHGMKRTEARIKRAEREFAAGKGISWRGLRRDV